MSRLLAKLQRERLADEHAKLVASALMESAASNVPTRGRSGEGDQRRMRGIPVIGRGVGGTIPGTDPLREAMRS